MGGLNLQMGARNGAKQPRQKEDFYATSPKAVELFLASLKRDGVQLNSDLWECACGQGHISKVLINAGYSVFSSDLINRGYSEQTIDFLKDEISLDLLKTDIITNPPYKMAKEFVLRGLDLLQEGNRLILFLKIRFLEGERRFNQIFRNTPPEFVYVHVTRQSCAMDGDFEQYCKSSGSECYCWFIFKKGYKGEPVLRWIEETI